MAANVSIQLLVFRLGADRYALRTGVIERILPLAQLKQLPLTPPYIAGLLNFHGEAVPVIDLCQLGGGAASRARFDTRIVLVRYDGPRRPDMAGRALGLIAEGVSAVQKRAAGEFSDSGVANGAAPYLGQIATDAEGILQLVELDHLLTDAVCAMLSPDLPAAEAMPMEPRHGSA